MNKLKELICIFWKRLKESCTEHTYESHTGKDFLKDSHELTVPAAFFCLLLGITSFVTNKLGDIELVEVAKEFLQLDGLRISFYLSYLFGGFSLLLVQADYCRNVFKRATFIFAKFGYSFSAIAMGATAGLVLPVSFQSESFFLGLIGTLTAVVIFAGFQWVFYWLVQYVRINHSEDEYGLGGFRETSIAYVLGITIILIILIVLCLEGWIPFFGV